MRNIILINPNTNKQTTAMMTRIAQKVVTPALSVRGVTACIGESMITNEMALEVSAGEVLRLGRETAPSAAALVVAAFGDPGLLQLRTEVSIPVAGLAEAAMLEAGTRRFGIATTTPGLVGVMHATVARLGLEETFTGIRLTSGDPFAVTADPEWLLRTLEEAVRDCIEKDGAQAVIIGGGPLGQAAETLQDLFSTPIIAPIHAALRQVTAAVAQKPQTLHTNTGDDFTAETQEGQ